MMDIYEQRSRWKIYLALAGTCILLISLFYTNYLAQRLREGERNKALLLFDAFNELDKNQDLEADLTLPTNIILANNDIPIIVVSNDNKDLVGRNFDPKLDTSKVFLKERLAKIKKKGPEPISISSDNQLLYYQNSRVLDLLTYFPYVQLLLLAAFISVGYISINNARRAEQNRVWVGMAKETAHQLGTPISAIIGWIEHLRESHYQNPEELDVLNEMQNDVARLDLIADRFSKIGSAPDLKEVDIYPQMKEITNYIRRRSPRKIVFEEPSENSSPLMVNINPHLFNWVD